MANKKRAKSSTKRATRAAAAAQSAKSSRGKQAAYFAVPPQVFELTSTEPLTVWGYDPQGTLVRLELDRTSIKAFTGQTGREVVGEWTWAQFLAQLQRPKTPTYKNQPSLPR